jgi:hypothetical protein
MLMEALEPSRTKAFHLPIWVCSHQMAVPSYRRYSFFNKTTSPRRGVPKQIRIFRPYKLPMKLCLRIINHLLLISPTTLGRRRTAREVAQQPSLRLVVLEDVGNTVGLIWWLHTITTQQRIKVLYRSTSDSQPPISVMALTQSSRRYCLSKLTL